MDLTAARTVPKPSDDQEMRDFYARMKWVDEDGNEVPPPEMADDVREDDDDPDDWA